MNHYVHYVSGFFVHRQEADDVYKKLIAGGISNEHIKIYTNQLHLPDHQPSESSNDVLKDMLVDGTIGSVVGTGIGALIEVALVATNVTLFVASPLVAPLVLLGWGASIGGLVGASVGAAENTKTLSALIEDAIKSGQIVVVAQTRSLEETHIAQDIIKSSIGDYKDVDAA